MSGTYSEAKVAPDLEGGRLEAGDASSLDRASIDDPRQSLPMWKWVLTLAGLYAGALLYGMSRLNSSAILFIV
jgi:hypothetical protein